MADDPLVVREVDDVETLKALSDPLRLAILRAMSGDPRATYRVKELAGLLDQPITRLYRHIKVLEAAGLIRVAQTRLVSGIQESRYQVAQSTVRLSRDLLAAPANAGDIADAFTATLNDVRDRLVRDITGGRLRSERDPAAGEDPLGPMIVALDERLPRARAVEFRSRLAALMAEYGRPGDGETGAAGGGDDVPVEFLMMFWSPDEGPAGI
ncbi:ArsR/SmtB family transcription factor [Streptomyces sp. NPDC049040]|uniref:ArsR/SmtB family transcription factor n=1 Tax=Streptomyces sp. NPDC049040 TaxID=3365593 RepID=UPI00371A7B54